MIDANIGNPYAAIMVVDRMKISNGMRMRRSALLRDFISVCPRNSEYLRVLDVGGRSEYWKSIGFNFLESHKVRIYLVNYSQSELYDVGGEPAGMFTRSVEDGCALSFSNKSFDICHSNSVIEHVGDFSRMELFASEMRRVSHSYYCQSPNYDFPIDPHFPSVPFFHKYPTALKAKMLRLLPIAYGGRAKTIEESYQMALSSCMLTCKQMMFLFPDAELVAEKFGGLAKSYIALKR